MMGSMEAQVADRSSREGGHLERFEPNEKEQKGRLIDAEHRGRYWWAAQLVEKRDVLDSACGTGYGSKLLKEAGAASVTAVDISAEAVEAARARLGSDGKAVKADLSDLPLHDDSFDLAVCFETIEHVDDGERAVAELRRVLRPDGVLLISSPNPDVYPPGNEHHVHEYRPTELVALVGELFSNLAIYVQHPWLASMIEPTEASRRASTASGGKREAIRRVGELEPAGQTYTIVVAGDGPLPELGSQVTVASDFEVKWWQEQLRNARDESKRSIAKAQAREVEATKRWEEASSALLQANQSLAQAVTMSHRLDEANHHVDELRALIGSIETSISWRITAPLRKLRKLGR